MRLFAQFYEECRYGMMMMMMLQTPNNLQISNMSAALLRPLVSVKLLRLFVMNTDFRFETEK